MNSKRNQKYVSKRNPFLNVYSCFNFKQLKIKETNLSKESPLKNCSTYCKNRNQGET